MQHFDLVIVGGGLVGTSLAIALSGQGFSVGLLEATDHRVQQHSSFDSRAIALSSSSVQFFCALNLWSKLSSVATPIKQIHVSEIKRFGATRLEAELLEQDALGYVLSAAQIGQTLQQACATCDDVTLAMPARLETAQMTADGWSLQFAQAGKTQTWTTDLLIAADGARSRVRDAIGMPAQTFDYEQTAIVANVGLARGHDHIAYERFTPQGPIAMLPYSDQRASLIWTVPKTHHTALMAQTDSAFLNTLQKAFGYRNGKFVSLGKRVSFPLYRVTAQRSIGARVVLMGNAAHSLHPVAGQGLNLSLRDVAVLSQTLVEARQQGHNIFDQKILSSYAQLREADVSRSLRFTDQLIKIFGSESLPIILARPLGLVIADCLPSAKKWLRDASAGGRGQTPKLLCGAPL